jgi:renalase
MNPSRHIAIIGAGIAGIACARTLTQAGHRVTVFEKSRGIGGRMSTRKTVFGSFDHGAQFFTVRDARFQAAINICPDVCQPWNPTRVNIMDSHGRIAAAAPPAQETHWVATPGMNGLVRAWAQPLVAAERVLLQTRVTGIAPDSVNPAHWQLSAEDAQGSQIIYRGFDQIVMAMPSPQTQALLQTSTRTARLQQQISHVRVQPCWTLMLAFPQAAQAIQAGAGAFGPHWHVAHSAHHRVSWLARESSKPGRNAVERWTVQANSVWSQEHINDEPARVQAKLIKAFAEITGIRTEPAHADIHRWLYATTEHALGQNYVLDATSGIALCGDWCIGHRVEDAFISGLELALAMA